ncbi:MAG: hypothetical protein M1546_00270 [Chloroflexi bacterium]|nr:hypothetical protein [Chloroflexota bacterium]
MTYTQRAHRQDRTHLRQLLAAVIMTATGRQPARAFVLAVVAVAITLVLVFAASPVWVDVLGVLVIAAGMVWSLCRPAVAASPRIALPI